MGQLTRKMGTFPIIMCLILIEASINNFKSNGASRQNLKQINENCYNLLNFRINPEAEGPFY